MKTEEIEETLRTLYGLRNFICERQRAALRPFILYGDLAVVNQIRTLSLVIDYLPKMYGGGYNAMVYLHYYMKGYDAWITELYRANCMAFGKARIGQGDPEYGYISIKELVDNNALVDLYWVPTPIEGIK